MGQQGLELAKPIRGKYNREFYRIRPRRHPWQIAHKLASALARPKWPAKNRRWTTSAPAKVLKAVLAGDKAAAQEVFKSSVAVIDRIADKKVVHKNKASRHKSRLSAKIKALAA